MAEKAGLTPSQMSDICNKDRSIDCVTYYKICHALNVPLDQFFEGMDLMHDDPDTIKVLLEPNGSSEGM